jgi:hypothetical protein
VRLGVTQYTKMNERNSEKSGTTEHKRLSDVRPEGKQGKERMSAVARSTRCSEIAKMYLGLELTVDELASKRS